MSDQEGTRGDLEFRTIPGLLAIAASRHHDRPALLDVAGADGARTYAQLRADALGVTRALMALGITRGDRVAIWAPNTPEWAVAALGAVGAGAVLVPINTRYKGAEAAYILERSGAAALLTVRGFLDTDYVALLRAAGAPPTLRHVILLRGDATAGESIGWGELPALAEQITPADAEARGSSVEPDDLSDIVFTSGTTGQPKGVMCTHAQSLRAFRQWGDVVGLREGDRFLVVPPFFHTFGYKAGLLASLMVGATVLPHAVFDAGAVIARVGADRIQVVTGPPALFQAMLAHPTLGTADRSSLRLAVTGAATIPVELIERMKGELGFETVLTAYGLSEGTGVSTMCRRGDSAATIASTSGRALPGVTVRVVGADWREAPRGEPGEVVVRGYTVMKGYLDDPAATAEAIDAEGFLHTGDVGVMDGEGNLKITDRMKDMFIVGGFNTYPAEIEHVLLAHPSVAQAAVIGVPDERLGEVGAAFIVARPGAAPSADELTAYCRERLANFKVPRRFELLDALPMNASGKVQKFRLRSPGG
jgi:HIP---CoA ligase